MKNTLIAALILAATSVAASAGTISLVPSTANPFAGDTFTIDLKVTGNTDEILGFGLNYNVNNSNITVTGATPDSFFGADLGLDDPALSVFTFPGNTESTVTLATFTFTANTVGSALFSITNNLSDANQGLFTLASPGGAQPRNQHDDQRAGGITGHAGTDDVRFRRSSGDCGPGGIPQTRAVIRKRKVRQAVFACRTKIKRLERNARHQLTVAGAESEASSG